MNLRGLRIILTYRCNRRCSFCYQKKFNKTISLKILRKLLIKLIGNEYDYITVMGGEVLYLKNYIYYLKLINRYFPKIKKSITTNGDFPLGGVKKMNYNITTSSSFGGGRAIIIDCPRENYSTNIFLDKLWYRWINKRYDIFISEKYGEISKIKRRRGGKEWITLRKN